MRKRSILLSIGVQILVASLGWSGCRSSPDARLLFDAGERLRLAYEKTASEQAIVQFQAALAIWERADRPSEAARAARQIGRTYEQLGALNDSLRAYHRALPLAQKSGEHLLESEVHSAVGFAQSLAGSSGRDLDDAAAHCERGLALAAQLSGGPQEAAALSCFGEVEYYRGNLERALDFYRRAGALRARAGDSRGQADSLLSQGFVYSDLRDLDRASACFDSALSLWNALGDPRGKGITLVADARLRERRGEYQAALDRYLQALTLLERIGDAIWEVGTLTGIAAVYQHTADTDRALQYWERSLQRLEAAGMKNTLVDVLISVGRTYITAGDDGRALERFERALTLAADLGNLRFQAYALRNISGVYVRRRQPEAARSYLERALPLLDGAGDRRLEAQVRADFGDVFALLEQHRDSAASFQRSLTLGHDASDRLSEARALAGLARASLGMDDLDAAHRYAARSLDVTESLRAGVQRTDLRTSYLASQHDYYELNTEILMRMHERRPRAGIAAAAFGAAERARARSLLDELTQAGVDLRAGADPELLKAEDALNKEFDDWSDRQRRRDRPLAAADAASYRDLEGRYDQIQAEIRSRSPRYAALTRPQPLSLAAVQKQVVADDTLLLEYALGAKRSFLWAVSRRGYDSYVLPPQREIETLSERVYARLTARLNAAGAPGDRRRQAEQADEEYWQDAARLSGMVLGPVAGRLKGKRLLIVADGALQQLPFAALPAPGATASRVPLVVEHEIVSLPSASVLVALRAETRNRTLASGAVAVLADPVFEADDPRLAGAAGDRRSVQLAARLRDASAASVPRLAATRHEADAIISVAPAGAAMKAIDFDASRATAMGPALAGYRIVHFATHGVFNNDQPGLSGVMLSMFDRRGQPQDGFLRLHDIYGLRLAAELVVLSACNTALGRSVKGEGLVGIVRGFMYAGARRVVASHWKVDDEATGELMARFYVEMFREHRSPAAALRQAQLALLKQRRWQSPFYWAAFVLQGEWS